jgi:putative DNA primase/helicase
MGLKQSSTNSLSLQSDTGLQDYKIMPYLNAAQIKQEAYGKWAGVLAKRGIPANYLLNKHGACPLCGGTDRYRFDDKTLNLTYYCNNCGHGSGLDLLMKYYSCSLYEALTQVHQILSSTDPATSATISPNPVTTTPVAIPDKTKQKILDGMIKFTSRTPTQKGVEYWDSRGIQGMRRRRIEGIQYGAISYGVYGTVKNAEGDYVRTQAIIGLFSQWGESPVGTLQIYLEEKKLIPHVPDDKTYISKPLFKAKNLSGAGIWLAGTAKSRVLHVAEGLENAVSIASMLNTRHVVATGTASLMRGLFVPDHVEVIQIWCDNDNAGLEAATKLKERYPNKKVVMHSPSDYGISGLEDWNDLIKSPDNPFS